MRPGSLPTGIPAIEIRSVSKTFVNRSWRDLMLFRTPNEQRALDNVTFSVRQGEIFGLLGPNGAGKTTIIKILAALILPDAGHLQICGHDPACHAGMVRQAIGMVNTSERSFYWRLSGRQNLDFFAVLHNLPKEARKRRINELLEMFDLMSIADKPFMKYSTGQQQRLAIGRALLGRPQVLLMDEPTRSLDPMSAAHLRDFVRNELARKHGGTVVWCTHNLAEATEMCDRMAIIHKGKILADGSLPEIRTLADRATLFRLKLDHTANDVLKKIGIEPVSASLNNGFAEYDIRISEQDIPSLLGQLNQNGVRIYACAPKDTDLNQIFAQLIQKAEN